MNNPKRLLIVGLVFLVLTLAVIFLKIEPFSPCGCPPATWGFHLLFYELFVTYFLAQYFVVECTSYGCVLNAWIIPIEFVSLGALCFGRLLLVRLRHR